MSKWLQPYTVCQQMSTNTFHDKWNWINMSSIRVTLIRIYNFLILYARDKCLQE